LELKSKQTRGRKSPAQMKGKTMKINKSWLEVLAAIAVVGSAQTSLAITYGQPDGNLHPSVGAWMLNWPDDARNVMASGTLIYKVTHDDGSATGVFLTAAHLTAELESAIKEGWFDLKYAKINFNPDPLPHPDQDVQVTAISSLFARGPGANVNSWDDVGVAVLEAEKAADLPEPAKLMTTVGFLDQFTQSDLHDSLLVAVGYGASLSPPPPRMVFENQRQFSTPKYLNLIDGVVTMQANGNAGNSGVAENDSGGALFWKDPQTGDETVVGIIIGAANFNAAPIAIAYRVDTQLVQDFLQGVIEDLDEF
jgi:hypothetical protein